jgi:hypothetical protein
MIQMGFPSGKFKFIIIIFIYLAALASLITPLLSNNTSLS